MHPNYNEKGFVGRSRSAAQMVHPLFQFFSAPEKWQSFGFDGYRFTRLWIAPQIGTILFHKDASKPSDFNTVAIGERVGHFPEKKINHPLSFLSSEAVFSFQRIDQIPFVDIRPLGIVNYISIVKVYGRLVNGRMRQLPFLLERRCLIIIRLSTLILTVTLSTRTVAVFFVSGRFEMPSSSRKQSDAGRHVWQPYRRFPESVADDLNLRAAPAGYRQIQTPGFCERSWQMPDPSRTARKREKTQSHRCA